MRKQLLYFTDTSTNHLYFIRFPSNKIGQSAKLDNGGNKMVSQKPIASNLCVFFF